MNTPKFHSIDDYLASLETTKANTLRTIITVVLDEFPGLEAKMAWNVPHIHRHGKYVVGLAAYKNHLTFSPWSAFVMADFKTRLEGFVIFKNCFQIPIDWKLDGVLIKDIVCARLLELG